jgi:predicted DNA-binding WGR domain protein
MLKPIQSPDSPSFVVTYVEQHVVLNYVSIESNSNKFYIMEFQEGIGDYPFRVYTEYGRMGRTPRKEGRYYLTRREAKTEFESILSSKKAKGYELVVIEEEFDDFSFKPKSLKKDSPAFVSPSSSLTLHTEIGELSEIQIHRGLKILEEMENELENGNKDLIYLTNKFYSTIPMVFGNKINSSGLVLNTTEKINEKKELLINMLSSLESLSNY